MRPYMHKQREKEDNCKRERGRKKTDSDRLELVQCVFTQDGKGVEDVARASLYIYASS